MERLEEFVGECCVDVDVGQGNFDYCGVDLSSQSWRCLFVQGGFLRMSV